MARSQMLVNTISEPDAVGMFARYLAEQLAIGKQGERHVMFNINERNEITVVKGTVLPAKFVNLSSRQTGEPALDARSAKP